MSTNYYWRFDECNCCERYNKLHIGKYSNGWEFMFQGYRPDSFGKGKELVSWQDWKNALKKDGIIVDEYGTRITLSEFIEMVEVHAKPGAHQSDGKGGSRVLMNHLDYILSEPLYKDSWPHMRDPKENWKDAQGYSFGISNFS